MDKKYRDMTKPKKPRRHTMSKDSPVSLVRAWISDNKGREFTRAEISAELSMLKWSQIYGVLANMRRGWDAFLDEHTRFYPDMDAKERHDKLVKRFFNKFHEAPVQNDPQTGKYSVLTWERKNAVDAKLEANHWKAAVRKTNERVNLREEGVTHEALEAAHTGLSIATRTVTDGLSHHTCGRLIGPSSNYCPQCGEAISPKQIGEPTKRITGGGA